MVLVESKVQAATFAEKLRENQQCSDTINWVIAAKNRRLEIRIQTDTRFVDGENTGTITSLMTSGG